MPPSPRLAALATSVPPIVLRQEDVVARVRRLFDDRGSEIERLLPAFAHAGIGTRYSCVPLEWFERDHGWAERGLLYRKHAVDLLEAAARACVARAGCDYADIDAIVTVSTTGIATPSLDAVLMQRLPFRRDVVRLPIFGLGCAGGVLGLARACTLARAQPGARVLFLVVELCAITFRKRDQSKSNIIGAALFGDGAAAALIGGAVDGPAITATGEYTWPDTLGIMGWHIEDDGLGVLFSRDIPQFVRSEFRAGLDLYLAKSGRRIEEIDRFVCHPGGAKVLDALETAFALPQGELWAAREVLHDYGNMSAATVLFVLERMLAAGGRRYLMTALGPGFTAAFLTLEHDA